MIACTDDDCETPPEWLSRMAAALQRADGAAVVFGNVRAAECDPAAGFILGCVRDSAFLARSIRHMHRVDGASACMGLKRSVWERLCGFDEFLGAGASFPSTEDMDFAIRALAAGFWVYATPEVEVLHRGFRSWDEEREVVHGYLYGIGAMFAKHIKCGNWGVLHYLANLFWRWAVTGTAVDFGRRPSRWVRLRAFALGVAAGLLCAVERQRSLFRRSTLAGVADGAAFRERNSELQEEREPKPESHGE